MSQVNFTKNPGILELETTWGITNATLYFFQEGNKTREVEGQL